LQKAGYSEFVSQVETATLAGGCFWGMEEILRKIEGVLKTRVGYCGGSVTDPTYPIVKKGQSGHAESVQLEFDPQILSFESVLGYFFKMHDPTTPNRQGNDRGSQYRSAIFYHSSSQRETAQRVKEQVEISKKWKLPIVTEIVEFQKFFEAEEYHQRYLEKNPGGYTCHYLRE
jgi:methionine-S-sulfoxide reductase